MREKKIGCDFESSVVESLRSGLASEEVAAHLEACANCREAARVVNFFKAHLRREPQPQNLPIANFVLWKYKLREKHRAAERAAQPIRIFEVVAVAVFAGLLVWLLTSDAFPFSSLASALDETFASIEPFTAPFVLAFACFGFVCLALVFVLRRVLPEK